MSKGFKICNKFSKVLPQDLRHLPADLYTREIGDASRIHEHDPEHIRKYLIKEAAKRQVAEMTDQARAWLLIQAWWRGLTKHKRTEVITQEVVDVLRGCVLCGRARHPTRGVDFGIDHVWFPEERGTRFSLKKGPAPRNGERPRWLWDMDLDIDVLDWPERIKDTLNDGGINFDRIMTGVKSAKERQDYQDAVKSAESAGIEVPRLIVPVS